MFDDDEELAPVEDIDELGDPLVLTEVQQRLVRSNLQTATHCNATNAPSLPEEPPAETSQLRELTVTQYRLLSVSRCIRLWGCGPCAAR